LKHRLVSSVLYSQMKSFAFFHEDFEGRNKASVSFIAEILTSLDSQMYLPGTTIIERGSRVKEMVLIKQGKCNLYGFRTSKLDASLLEKLHIVRLPEKSWFGDF